VRWLFLFLSDELSSLCWDIQKEDEMKKLIVVFIVSLAIGFSSSLCADEITTLETVVVTGTRTPQAPSQVVSSVSVINAEQIAATGATRLEDVLRDTIGLQIVSNGPAGSLSSPIIRGSEANQVLVLLDGVRLNSTQNGQFNLSNLPIALGDIERIEILRGPSSALYGSNALAGVIQIFTQQPEAVSVSHLRWREGRFATRKMSASTMQKLGFMRYRLGTTREQSDGYRQNTDFEQQGVNGLIGLSSENGYDLELVANYLDKELGVPGPTSFPSPNARQWDKNSQTALTLSGPAGPLNIKLKGVYDRQRSEYQDPDGFFPTHDTHKLKTIGTELQISTTLGQNTLLFGGDLYQDKIGSTANGDQKQDHWSTFGQYEINPTSRVTLLLGLRYDAHSDFNNETSPRAAAKFILSESTSLRVSAAKAFRAPTLNDRFWPDTGWTKGNPNLIPETAWEYEVALDQQLSDRGDISLAIFRRDAENLIEWADDGSGVWSPSNVSDARIWGGEIGTNLQLHKLLKAGANYTYLYPKNETTDKFITGKARHQGHLYFEVGPVKGARLRLDGRYLHYFPEAARVDKSHFVFDASVSRSFMLSTRLELELELSVKNLLDEEYEESLGYPMPPRQFFAGISAYF
jgi:outer membrane cobalamin receptor